MAARPWIRVYPQEPNDAIQPVRANPGPRNMPRRNAQPIAYFYLMFSTSLLKKMVQETNR